VRDDDRLDWTTHGRDWPLREFSRFVEADGMRWHVQELGAGPVALLLHGTGASTHSWRGLAPLLARSCRVVAMDLPGHGFTGALPRGSASLPRIADAVAALVRTLDATPAIVVGNSAGAAIGARMALDGSVRPRALVSLNGALLPLSGLAGAFFSPVARLLAANSLAATMFSWRAQDPAAVRRLMASTGSSVDARSLELYGRLVRNPGHVDGTLQMMAGWELESLQRDLPRLHVPTLLLVGTNDGTVPPTEADRVRRILGTACIERLQGLGHLAHEEQPQLVADSILRFAAQHSVSGA
jgi:magnesium chelatase accessory protein